MNIIGACARTHLITRSHHTIRFKSFITSKTVLNCPGDKLSLYYYCKQFQPLCKKNNGSSLKLISTPSSANGPFLSTDIFTKPIEGYDAPNIRNGYY